MVIVSLNNSGGEHFEEHIGYEGEGEGNVIGKFG
jgi:hypothetical protein